jgi:hypothetical protein
MLFGKNAWKLTIYGVLLACLMTGCSKSDKPKKDEVFAATSGLRTPWDDIRDLYRDGHPEQARKKSLQVMENFLITVETAKQLRDRIAAQEALAVTVEEMMQGENKLPKTQATASRQAVADCIAKLKQGNSLLAKKIEKAALTDKEKESRISADKKNAIVVKNWILMNPKEKREELYKNDKELLEAQGIKAADLVNASDEPPKPTADDLLMQNAKADTEQIRELLKKYYRALNAEDADALRSIASKDVTDKPISQLVANVNARKKELKISEIVSTDLDKADIQVRQIMDHHVIILIQNVKVTFKINGRDSSIERDDLFFLNKEKDGWVLWFK